MMSAGEITTSLETLHGILEEHEAEFVLWTSLGPPYDEVSTSRVDLPPKRSELWRIDRTSYQVSVTGPAGDWRLFKLPKTWNVISTGKGEYRIARFTNYGRGLPVANSTMREKAVREALGG